MNIIHEFQNSLIDLRAFWDKRKENRSKRRDLFQWARGIAVNSELLDIVHQEIVSKGVLTSYAAKKDIPSYRENAEIAFLCRLAEAAGIEIPSFDEKMKAQFLRKEIEPVVGWRHIDDNRLFVRKNGGIK